MEVSTNLETPPGSARAAVAPSRPEGRWDGKGAGGSGPCISHSPFSRHRSLQRVLDDAYARSNHRLFEELLGGILSLFGSRTGDRGE